MMTGMTMTEPLGGWTVPQWTLGERLRKARTHVDLTVDEMADELGCTTKTIYNYEQDRTVVRVPALKLWALRTGVPLLWLIEGDEGGGPHTRSITAGYPPHPAALPFPAQDCYELVA